MSSREVVERLRQRLRRSILRALPSRLRFAVIYRLKWWGGRSSESASGMGSSLAATEQLREALPGLLAEIECKKLLDLGCGGFHWMKEVALPCDYLGVDIVSSVISANQRDHARSGIDFAILDGTSDPIPDDVDVILCREVLFHMSFADIWSCLDNMKRSNARYLLLTQSPTNERNKDVHTGGFRPLDLTTAPFSFPPARKTIRDDSISEKRCMALWSIHDIVVSGS